MRQQSNDAGPSNCCIDKQPMTNINAIAFADNKNKTSLELRHSLHPIDAIWLELKCDNDRLKITSNHFPWKVSIRYAPKWNYNRFNIEMFILLQAVFCCCWCVSLKFLLRVDQHQLIRFQNTWIRLNEHEQAIHKLFICCSFIVYTLDFYSHFFIDLIGPNRSVIITIVYKRFYLCAVYT